MKVSNLFQPDAIVGTKPQHDGAIFSPIDFKATPRTPNSRATVRSSHKRTPGSSKRRIVTRSVSKLASIREEDEESLCTAERMGGTVLFPDSVDERKRKGFKFASPPEMLGQLAPEQATVRHLSLHFIINSVT